MKQVVYREIFFSTAEYVLLRNFFIVITGVISIFIVRLLGPYEYGKYALVMNLISTFGPILSLGWLSTLAKFIPEKIKPDEKAVLFSQSLFSTLILAFMFFLVIQIVNKFFPQILPKEIKDIIFIFTIFTIFVSFFNIFEGFWRGLGKFNEFVVIDGLRSNIGNFAGLLFLVFGFVSYKVVIYNYFFVSFLFLVFLFFTSKKYIKLNITKPQKEILVFCLSLLFGQTVHMLSVNVDIVMLRGLLKDPQQVGYYTAGIRIPRLIEGMFIGQVAAPMLYYFSLPEASYLKEKILLFSAKMLGVMFGIVALIFFSLSKHIVVFLFGKKFIEAAVVFQYFSLCLPFLGFLIIFSPFYSSKNKPYVLVIFHFLTIVLTSTLMNIFLIPKFRFFAPVISYLISLLIFSIIVCIDCYKRFNLNLVPNLTKLTIFILLSTFLEKITKIPLFSVPTFILICFITKTISIEDISKFESIFIKKK